METDLLHVHNVQFRKALTRVRLSSHNMDKEQKSKQGFVRHLELYGIVDFTRLPTLEMNFTL